MAFELEPETPRRRLPLRPAEDVAVELTHRDKDVRHRAAFELAGRGVDVALPIFVRALKRRNADVHEPVYLGLAALKHPAAIPVVALHASGTKDELKLFTALSALNLLRSNLTQGPREQWHSDVKRLDAVWTYFGLERNPFSTRPELLRKVFRAAFGPPSERAKTIPALKLALRQLDASQTRLKR